MYLKRNNKTTPTFDCTPAVCLSQDSHSTIRSINLSIESTTACQIHTRILTERKGQRTNSSNVFISCRFISRNANSIIFFFCTLFLSVLAGKIYFHLLRMSTSMFIHRGSLNTKMTSSFQQHIFLALTQLILICGTCKWKIHVQRHTQSLGISNQQSTSKTLHAIASC